MTSTRDPRCAITCVISQQKLVLAMTMRKKAGHVRKAVSSARSSIDPSGTLQSITLEDESTVVINLLWTQVSLLYLDPGTYPCGAFLSCHDSTLEAKLLPVAERLQDRAPLTLALAEVGLTSCDS